MFPGKFFTGRAMGTGSHPDINDLKRIRSLSEFSDGQLSNLRINWKMSGTLSLPGLPGVAQRIQQAFADNAVNAESICTIIQA